MNRTLNTIFIIFLALTSFEGLSQAGILNGKIYSWEMDEYLDSTSVKIQHTNFIVITDKNGFFKINGIPFGKYTLEIDGYDGILKKEINISQKLTEIEIKYPYCEYTSDYKIKTNCPICNKKDKVIPIYYGLIDDKESLKKAKRGEIKLGGCMVSFCDPNWYCKRDKKYY